MKSVAYAILLLALGVMSCKNSTEPDQTPLTPVKDTLIFTYDSVASFPNSQSSMLCGNSQNIFIYGAYGNLSVYDIASRTITDHSTPTDTFSWRWDGAFVSVDSLMYIFAIPNGLRADYQQVLSFSPITYKIKGTTAANPFTKHMYPASAVYGNTIVLLYPISDSLYVFNTGTMTGRFVSPNKLKAEYNSKIYSSGIFGNNFYVFGLTAKQLFKINLQTYVWDEVPIPDSIKSNIAPYALGGVIGNKLCLFNFPKGPGTTVAYNMETQKWLVGNPSPALALGIYEPYFYSAGGSLYFSEVFSNALWKITLSQ